MKNNVVAIVYSSVDPDNGDWTPVLPDDVPEAIKDPEVIGNMMNGDIAKADSDDRWFRVAPYEE